MNPTLAMPSAFDSHAWGTMKTIQPQAPCLQAHPTRLSRRSHGSRAVSCWRQHILNARSFVGLVALGFVLLGADRALAATVTVTAATGGSAISADTANGAFTTLTGPV